MRSDLLQFRRQLDALADLIDALELELVDDPAWGEPSDTSYLTAADRNDPDIMSNVEAMAKTNALISWWGRDMEGFVGLWRGPTNTPLEQAPVVRLDTEGQYSLVATSIGDYLLISSDEDAFDDHRQLVVAAGLTASASRDAIWASLDGFDDPNAYRHVRYNEGRVRRSLPPVD